jgi:3',5'-cyclic AMP phosphodiesterase CpdA
MSAFSVEGGAAARRFGGGTVQVQTAAPFRFAVIGDFGTGNSLHRAVAARMCRWHKNRRQFDLVVTTGDNVYPDGARRHFRAAFFRPYRYLRNRGVRFRASLGNHDVLTNDGRPELREPRFGMKARNYIVRRSGVRFVIVNSNNLNRPWLRSALTTELGDRWTVVVFHHPVFSPETGHGSTSGFRPVLPRMFARKDVDLVLNGHDHIYAASKPLRRIRYVVSGGGGAPLYGCSNKWFSAACRARHHWLPVETDATDIEVRAVPSRGRPFHKFITAGRI